MVIVWILNDFLLLNVKGIINIPYLPEYKSQLQHLFLLLISRVRLILRMFRVCVVYYYVTRKARPRPYGRGRERWCSARVNVRAECAHDGACMLGSEDGEADELL